VVRILLASRNPKKLEEMRRILAEHLQDVEVLGLDDVPAYDEPVEDRPTFAGNALLKARAGLAAPRWQRCVALPPSRAQNGS